MDILDRAQASLMSETASSEPLDAKTTAPTSRSSDLEPSAEWRARHIGLDESWHPKVKTLAMTAESFVRHSIRNAPRRSRWLVVGGQTGCGKTHAAKRILKRFRECRMWAWEQGYWDNPPHAAYWSWSKLAALDGREWVDALEEIMGDTIFPRADLLIIDDIGAEVDKYKTGEPVTRLQSLLDIMERRWLLITTNVQRANWADRWDRRIASRLSAAAYLSLFNVPDYRPKLARK